MKLRALGIPTFCPSRLIRQHRKGSPVAPRPIFPCYTFADYPLDEWRALKRVPHVVDVCRTGDEVVEIPQAVMAELEARCDEHGIVPAAPFETGRVYPINGRSPLTGLAIMLERIGGKHATGWLSDSGLRARIVLADLVPEPIETPQLTRAEKYRQTRPLERQRKLRNWQAIE